MNSVSIKVHSTVAIITNSSTEIFVEATENTIENVKNLINALLSLAGSDKKCDDLFDIKLNNQNEDCDPDWAPAYPEVSLKVTAKVVDENAETAAGILSKLTDIFNIEAGYDG